MSAELNSELVCSVLRRNLPGAVDSRRWPTIVSRSAQEREEQLYDAVISKVWRRTKIDRESANDLRHKIKQACESDRPLEFSIPFGGYKGWQVRDCPHANWAEAFFLFYLQQNGKRIAGVYPPGVIYTLTYASGVLDLVSNSPPDWQSCYIQELTRLLSLYSTEHVIFRIVDISSTYASLQEVREELFDNYRRISVFWDASSEDQEKRIASARRNLVRVGVEDLSLLTDTEWNLRVVESAKMCDALDRLERRRQFNKYSSRIQLVLVRGPVPALHIGSCRSSSFHPWVGSGCVDLRGSKGALERVGAESSLAKEAVTAIFAVPKNLTLGMRGLETVLVLT